METRHRTIVAVIAGLVAVGLALWLVSANGDDDAADRASTGSTTTESTSESSTPTSASSTTIETTTTSVTPGTGTVIELDAYPGAGSEEIELAWRTISGATGYRVLRADSAEGTFRLAAEIDVTTGEATAEDAINIWSDQHTYLPAGQPLTAVDTSTQLRYVEHGGARFRCFEVVALGPSGPGPASATVCGSPP
jgi:hypothetical protein